MMRTAEAFLKTLQAWGVKYFFGCPGTTEAAILDTLVDHSKPEFILCSHEITAVAAADGYARITGRPGVVLLHANVGLGNGISGIHAARTAKSPVVVINCIKSTAILGHGAFTTVHDHQEMVKQYTKWNWQTLSAQALVEDLERALRLSQTPPPGPTYLAIPEDILAKDVDAVEISGPFEEPLHSRPSGPDIERAAEMLAKARFPLILAGSDIAREDAMDQVVKLAHILSAPVCSENRMHMAYNAYPTEEAHFVGPYSPGAEPVIHSDVILAIGCKLFVEWAPPAMPWIPVGTRLIHLYPDPDDIGNLYRPAVGLCGSIKFGIEDFIAALLPRLEQSQQALADRNQRVRAMHADFIHRRNNAFESVQGDRNLNVVSLVRELAGIMNQDVTLVADAVTSSNPIVEYVPRFNTKNFFGQGTGGNLGWGLGAALGIKLAAPNRNVICIIGDGVCMFGLPALQTAEKYDINLTYIVINNSRYAAVISGLLHYNGKAAQRGIFPGTDISGPDYSKIAEGFGISSLKVVSKKDLSRLSDFIDQDDHPGLIEIIVNPGKTPAD
jgi:benzoylformate decarboxylase